MKRIAIVAPCHIQPTQEWVDSLLQEVNANSETNIVDIIIVDDSDGKISLPETWKVFDYAKQKEFLGDDLYAKFEQFHKSSSCKNFGLIYAYRKEYDVTIVIDSDCNVPMGFIAYHLAGLAIAGNDWENVLQTNEYYSRGFPYAKRNIKKWCHMGLWVNELDMYGTDRVGVEIPEDLSNLKYHKSYNQSGSFFPLSGMNLSFVREALPYMLFVPNFDYKVNLSENEEYIKTFRRCDDIWGGYIFQKIAKLHNASFSYGLPYVYHDTVVVAEEDAKEEEGMIEYEDEFYDLVDSCLTTPTDGWLSEFTALSIFSGNDDVFQPLAKAFDFQLEAYKQ